VNPHGGLSRPGDLIPLADARRAVLDGIGPLPAQCLPLEQALGCVTAERIVATSDIPAFTNSAMDGYAVRAADTTDAPARLQVTGTILAGDAPSRRVGQYEAQRIMTGACLPAGADAVVPVEQTRPLGEVVEVLVATQPQRYVRPAGSDIGCGEELLAAGTPLTPSWIGALASAGVESVAVRPRPRVGVLSTGDELVGAGAALVPGRIRDANRPALLALLRQGHFDPVDLGQVGDDESAIADSLVEGAVRCDAVLTSGGVSVGDVDLVKVVLHKLCGVSMRWMQVAIKPAKPFVFGRLTPNDVPVFGLAGNPVSAVVGFELFARPALRAMAGHGRLDRPIVRARAVAGLEREPDGKVHLMRVVVQNPLGRWEARSSGAQGSHVSLGLARANGLALVPDGHGIPAGGEVDVIVLDDEGVEGRDTTLDDMLGVLP
jgi:molybdenum cofactor synthesis domain-containing protein